MSKRSKQFKLVAYDVNGNEFASSFVQSDTFEGVFSLYLNFCESVGTTYKIIKRVDLLCGSHTLFVFADVRSLVDQRNKSLIIQNY